MILIAGCVGQSETVQPQQTEIQTCPFQPASSTQYFNRIANSGSFMQPITYENTTSGIFDAVKIVFVLPHKASIDYRGLIADTGSMRPTFDSGDMLIVQYNPSDLQRGDIIYFRAPAGIVTTNLVFHRIMDIKSDKDGIFYQTKGDNNIYADDFKVRPDMIIGRVVGILV